MFLFSVLTLGCQCGRPALPTATDPPPIPTRPPPPPEDTGEEPQCAWVEEEPNDNSDQANTLPMEQQACGQFTGSAGDSDNWAFQVAIDAWVAIDVEAEQLGSLANPAAVVVAPGGAFSRNNDDVGGDVSLLVPLVPGAYNLQIFEQNFSGADDGRWFYDVQVSEQKAPRGWTDVADEPNQDASTAMLVADGDAIYGTIEGPTDEDWFRIDIPAGRHNLTVSAEAFGSGSPLDSLFQLRNEAGVAPACPSNPDCRFDRGETGFEADPWGRYTSEGDETIYVRFRNELSGGSPFHWYVLDIQLEVVP